MARQYWLVKQEPSDYAWSTFEGEGRTVWTGVRNFAARNHLRAMKLGDLVGYYHSGDEKAVVGAARVVREAYPDPTTSEGDWSCVELEPVKEFGTAVSLATIKADDDLRKMELVRQSRLSVVPVTPPQWERLLKLAGTRL